MSDFLQLVEPEKARALLLSSVKSPAVADELLPTGSSLHRITAEDIFAPHALPEFARSTVDGYAVKARDLAGASPAQPAYLRLAGEVLMGSEASLTVGQGECALIHTGGMLPKGADAVTMVEDTQIIKGSAVSSGTPIELEMMKSCAPGANVIAVGEDVKKGQVAVEAGEELRPQHVGGLMALGILQVRVRVRPRVGIISSGDEVVQPHIRPSLGQVRDVNAHALGALIDLHGGQPVYSGIVRDDRNLLEAAARAALGTCDMLVITAGSSTSTRDLTAATVASLGRPGVLVHGLNIRPGKPTILGVCGGKAVVGLPGNPVSALIIAREFVVPLLSRLLGRRRALLEGRVNASLTVNLASQTGREDWWPVRLSHDPDRPETLLAAPVFGRSNLVFSLVAADGLIKVAADKGGLAAGELVEVRLI